MNDAGTIRVPAAGSVPSSDDPHASRWKKRVTLGSVVAVLLAAALVLPPLINVGRYQRQVTTLVSRSLGRPVQLSSVGLRLLPRPGFILHDLSVAEDPEFGAEPVLSARTVVASIRITSLWKGKLALDRVSVDEASLNLVRSAEGRWNLESLMMGAQPSAAQGTEVTPGSAPSKPAAFPYLEATNSRVHLKQGIEKSPFSIVNTDLSLWQDDPGQWRVRLRGQPVRTDIEMSWADTGEVRMEATLYSASQLREMPLRLQMEWRDAHLGQLSRLILGSDAGWRGDLTADIDLQGTPESAHTKARLKAVGVRREEFAPETPLDLDANCTFLYQHSQNALHTIACDTALGAGQLHLKAELPGNAGPPQATLEVKRVPLQAALDLLHTVRSGFAPGVSARGIADGTLTYKKFNPSPTPPDQANPASPAKKPSHILKVTRSAKAHSKPAPSDLQVLPTNLQGSLTLAGAILKGGELKDPLVFPTMTWQPAPNAAGGLETRFTIAIATPPSAFKAPSSRPDTDLPLNPVDPPKPDNAAPQREPARTASTPAQPPPAQPVPAQPTPSEPNSSSPPQPQTESATQPAQSPTPQTAQAESVPHQPVLSPSAKSKASNPAISRATAPTLQALNVRLAVKPRGYELGITGSAPVSRLRSLAYAFGLPHSAELDSLEGGSSELDLASRGGWIESLNSPDSLDSPQPDSPKPTPATGNKLPARSSTSPNAARNSLPAADPNPGDALSGTIQLRHTQWKPPYLPQPVNMELVSVAITPQIASQVTPQTAIQTAIQTAVLTSDFSYGEASDPSTRPLQGTVRIQSPISCNAPVCKPDIHLHFTSLDAASTQAALIGPPVKKSMLSPLMDRVRSEMSSSSKPVWPLMTVDIDADSLTVGPTTFRKAVAQFRTDGHGDLEITSWSAQVLGGSVNGTGSVQWSGDKRGDKSGDKPEYSFEGSFTNLTAPLAGTLAGSRWTGAPINGTATLKLSGLDWKDLESSAVGEIHFTWHGGTIPTSAQPVRFEDWSGTLAINSGNIQMTQNQMTTGKHELSLAGTIPLSGVAKFTLPSPADKLAAQPR